MSGERFSTQAINSLGEYYLYLKAVFVYEWCGSMVKSAGLCLDLGCGDGYGTKIISGSAKKTVGLDIEKAAVESANKKYAGDKCSFLVYDGVNLPFADESCDAVICLQVIEHVKNPEKFLAEIFRVLKKQGILVLATPNRILRLDPGMPPWNIYHFREYSPSGLKTVLSAAFGEVKMFGLAISGAAKDIEEKRVNRSKRIARLDFFNLRRLLPKAVLAPVVAVLNLITELISRKKGKNFDLGVKPGQYYNIKEDDFENSFDIMAVCRK